MLKPKHLWHTVLSVLMCGCFLLLPSCSSDEPDSGDNQTDVPEDNLSDAARNFVGFWEVTENGKTSFSDLELFADGYCSSGYNVGYWALDETSNILSITLDSGTQWQITLSNSDSWVGLNLNNNRTCTAKRHSLLSDFDNHVDGKWLSDSTEITLNWRVTFVKPPFKLDYRKNRSGNYYMEFSNLTETDNGVMGNYCVWYYYDDGIKSSHCDTDVSGTFTYVNANYYKSRKFIFTGSLEGTFTYDLSDLERL
jgi:hypothetical protein